MTANKATGIVNKTGFNENIYVLKALAIFSVICAHCCSVSDNSGTWNIFVSDVLSSIGTVGIFIFYFLSGYFLCLTGKKTKDFWKQKIFSVIIPWLFCGTAVYMYVYLRGEGISLRSWAKWIIGMDTYLYYVMVLLIFYLIFYWLRRSKTVIIIFTILSLGENILLFFIPNEVFLLKYPYLDPLRFGYIFSLGLLVANCDLLPQLMQLSKKLVVYTGILSVAAILIPTFYGIDYTYFVIWYVPFAMLTSFFLLGLCQYINGNISVNTGRWSYAVYLVHMPIAGIVAYICGRIDNPFVTLLRPFIVLVAVYLPIMIIIKISSKVKFLKFINTLIGLR